MKRVPVPTEAIRAMIEDVAAELGVPSKEIRSQSQKLAAARARHICCAVGVDVMRATRQEVGAALNRPDATVHESTQRGRKLLLWDTEARRVYEAASAAYLDRFKLALIGELAFMNRMVARYRKRAAVIAELLGVEGEQQRAEAAE